MTQDGRVLRAAVLALVIGAILLPIVAGLWQTAQAAFGFLPAIGANSLGIGAWQKLFSLPGFSTSLKLTLWTGFASTALALMLSAGLCATLYGTIRPGTAVRYLAPILATPHAALAIGLAFVLAPSGWLARLVSPWATGWTTPVDMATVNDPFGGALILGLVLKELPFFVLVMLVALGQLPVAQSVASGRALGYSHAMVWLKIVLPQVWPLIRLPTYIVMAFALSVVDMAIILGPSNPPTLAVAVTRWFMAADTTLILPASAGALLQAIVIIASIGALWLAEKVGAAFGRRWLRRGRRGLWGEPILWGASALVGALALLGLAALLALLLWSVAWRWPFPLAIPESWSLRVWLNPAGGWGLALANTLAIAVAATVVSTALAIAWLEGEDRGKRPRAAWAAGLITLPLLVPQIGFLYGLNVVLLRAGVTGGLGSVIWVHVLFVFPYVMIALSRSWRALDPRLLNSAKALGASPLRCLLAVKLPILVRPILTAGAIGFSVSVAQYLPTLFMGAGRVATLTTEAVTLSSGSDRRVVGVYAVLQAFLPFAAYAAALLLPAALHQNRRALTAGSMNQ